ncbi:MAG: hypothetical protein JW727_01305 [Candidatus Aenigmarchaeota archaeon]|nr:hypothetical protein [Candidatus Aenigmarchaeota archaeon]
MELESVALMLIVLVSIAVSIGFLTSVGSEAIGSPIEKFASVFREAAGSIAFGKSYDICQEYNGKLVAQKDMEAILQAMYDGKCSSNQTSVQTSFSLTKEDIAVLMKSMELGRNASQIFYRRDLEPIGIGAVIIRGNPGNYPIKMWDKLELKFEGAPQGDIIITVTEEGCDPYDDNCEVMCSYMEGVCDPLCYQEGTGDGTPCDIDCVDSDGNGNISGVDMDGICDLDCYNNFFDPQRAYDPDCAWQNVNSPDGICDPDSMGVVDGVCDPDCAENLTMCDPDCDGVESDGNPGGLLSSACYVCDKTCNGFCSMSCEREDNDSDCPKGFQGFNNLTECCGNGKCSVEAMEDCKTCSKDCPAQGVTCENLGMVCCPSYASLGNSYGCSTEMGLKEGEKCACSSQCDNSSGLSCTGGHCCPLGYMWSEDEGECVDRADVLIVAIKANMGVYSEGDISRLEDKIEDFRSALSSDGLGSMFLYLDSDEVEDICGKKVTSPKDWRNIRATTVPLIKQLDSKYLIIIGGHARFPQTSVASTGSDAPYGDISDNGDGGKYLMDISVGRFPDPAKGDMDVILNALDTAIGLHKSGGVSLSNKVSPIMGCGGLDNRQWNSGKCFCSAVYGSSCQACSGCCGNLGPSSTSNKGFVMILAHGPGPAREDLYYGGGFNVGPSFVNGISVKNTVWMTMACGGAHLALKQTTSDSIAMTFLKNGGAVFFGSTDNNLGSLGSCYVLGGDNSIGSLYVEIALRFKEGVRIGDAYREGKNAYFPKYNCPYGQMYHYHINCLLGDPTLKIKKGFSA